MSLEVDGEAWCRGGTLVTLELSCWRGQNASTSLVELALLVTMCVETCLNICDATVEVNAIFAGRELQQTSA